LVAEQVHGGPVQVPRRILHRDHRLPTLEHPGERLLGQILGLGPAPGDHRQGPEQAFLLLLEERLERGRLRVHNVYGCLPRRPKVGDISHH